MIWEKVLDYMKYCGIVKYELFGPMFLCSMGAHIGNFHNKGISEKNPFYTHMGTVPDMRIHLFLIAPPGYGKTIYIRFFTDKRYGILREALSCINQQSLTCKGLIGGFDREEVPMPGDAQIYADAIFGIDEFDHVVKAAAAEHSSDLENSLLDLLDSGQVRYRPGTRTPLEYDSYITMFAGTQPERFSLSSGLTRRMAFVDMCPDSCVTLRLSEAYDENMNVEPDMTTIRDIRKEIKWLWENFKIQKVIIPPEYRIARNKLATDHLEKAYLDKFAIGYHIIRYWRGDPNLTLYMDSDLNKLMIQLREMKIMCLSGASEISVLKMMGDTVWTLTELKKTMVRKLSIDYKKGSGILDSLMKRHSIHTWEATTEGAKKPTRYVQKLQEEQEVEQIII
jgi:hypothetical protein